MKKFVLLSILSLLSCSSHHKFINDYLVKEFEKDTIKLNIIFREKTSFNDAFRVFQGMNPNSKTSKELKINTELKQKYANENFQVWKNNDFKNISFKIIKKDSINEYIENRKKDFRHLAYRFNVYSISKPYFYNGKKNLFFYIRKDRIDRNRIFDEVVIMENKNGNWIVIEKRENTDL